MSGPSYDRDCDVLKVNLRREKFHCRVPRLSKFIRFTIRMSNRTQIPYIPLTRGSTL
jgi:hypothetical protein